MKCIVFLITVIISVTGVIFGDSIHITQVDSNNLLRNGEINIYFSLNTELGEHISLADFSLLETELVNGEPGTERPLVIKDLSTTPNVDKGIDFILLIDNSGSMWEESVNGKLRIDHAKWAASQFLREIDPARDRVGCYVFNTYLKEVAPLGSEISSVNRALSFLGKPNKDEAYTELYNSLETVLQEFDPIQKRKVVIVLSDGENFPVHQVLGMSQADSHPIWGQYQPTPEILVDAFWNVGVSLFGINMAARKDPHLQSITESSGGSIFNAGNSDELSQVYHAIRDSVQGEMCLTVSAPVYLSSDRRVTLQLGDSVDSRNYYVPLIFGSSTRWSPAFLLGIIFLGIGIVAVLFIIPFEGGVNQPELQSVNSRQKISLNENMTVIGTGNHADFTLGKKSRTSQDFATIVRDERRDSYTLVSNGGVKVNNNNVRKRKLNPGDVIQVEGSTIVFDSPSSPL